MVAVVPAFDGEATVGATVHALAAIPAVTEVVVVDDGSRDGTAAVAARAGARVVRLGRNAGKAAAVEAGVEASPTAEIYLLVDADVGATAAGAAALLVPVVAGDADLAIGVLPGGSRGGFGAVRRLAAAGIARATGWRPRAPLSGQRAVRADLLRALPSSERFGLETAMTIDACRAGARVVEVDVDMSHRPLGRSPAGFSHRARQGLDIARELYPRVSNQRARFVATIVVFVAVATALVWSSSLGSPATETLGPRTERVVLFGMPGVAWQDLGTGTLPNLDALIATGSTAAMSVRTASGRPSTVEAYAALGAGARVPADDRAGLAFSAPGGGVVVAGAQDTRKLASGRHLPSAAGALGDALRAGGRRAAVVGNGDVPEGAPRPMPRRPAAAAVMTSDGSVPAGRVDAGLLRADPAAPFGVRADPEAVVTATQEALGRSEVVFVDPGDYDRARSSWERSGGPSEALRLQALRSTDAILGRLRAVIDEGTLLLVAGTVPPATEWHLTPLVAAGAGTERGSLWSPSTRRRGLVTLTDLAPTILGRVGVPIPEGMIGHVLEVDPRVVPIGSLARLDRDAAYRERIYLPVTIGYIVLQALVYLAAIVAFMVLDGPGRAAGALRWIVLAIAAHPLGTFVFRALPGMPRLGWAGVAVLLAVDAAVATLALRFRRHGLSPLQFILGATIALIAFDVATGARLQQSSILGYSPHTAARFRGLGNTAFAALAASAVLFGCIAVAKARWRRDALVAVAMLFALVVLVDGAPTLGSDVGGIVTLVPVFGLTLFALAGRRITVPLVLGAGATAVLGVGLAAVVDTLREPTSRTHLGRLVSDVVSGGSSPLTTTIARKLATNFRTFGSSPWTWAVIVLTVYLLVMLLAKKGWTQLLPPRSAVRVAAVATLTAGLLGYATNDSGIVVTAIVFVYLGPFLTLLALERAREADMPPLATG